MSSIGVSIDTSTEIAGSEFVLACDLRFASRENPHLERRLGRRVIEAAPDVAG